jgi:hypothetical protein
MLNYVGQNDPLRILPSECVANGEPAPPGRAQHTRYTRRSLRRSESHSSNVAIRGFLGGRPACQDVPPLAILDLCSSRRRAGS